MNPKDVGVSTLTEFLALYTRISGEGSEALLRAKGEVYEKEKEVEWIIKEKEGVERVLKKNEKKTEKKKKTTELVLKKRLKQRRDAERWMFWTKSVGHFTVYLDGNDSIIAPPSSSKSPAPVLPAGGSGISCPPQRNHQPKPRHRPAIQVRYLTPSATKVPPPSSTQSQSQPSSSAGIGTGMAGFFTVGAT